MRRGICVFLVAGGLAALPAIAQAAKAPVLQSVTQTSSHHLKVSWSGQFNSPFVEIATSAAVDANGYFMDSNAMLQPLEDFETSWESGALDPGTYYVHVGGLDPACLSCSYQFSSIKSIKIGSGGAPKKQRKGSLFSVLSVPSRQRIAKLYVRAGMVTAGKITVTGAVVSGRTRLYKFKSVAGSTPSTPGASVKLRPKLPAKALKAVKRALRHGKQLRARLFISARDKGGGSQGTTRTVRLKR